MGLLALFHLALPISDTRGTVPHLASLFGQWSRGDLPATALAFGGLALLGLGLTRAIGLFGRASNEDFEDGRAREEHSGVAHTLSEPLDGL